MLFTIEFKYNSEVLNRIESKLDILTTNQEKIMATLAEIIADLEVLEQIVASEDAEFDTKVAELTSAVDDLTEKLATSDESNAALQAAVEQLQVELAAANDPAVLQGIADRIAALKTQVAGIVE